MVINEISANVSKVRRVGSSEAAVPALVLVSPVRSERTLTPGVSA